MPHWCMGKPAALDLSVTSPLNPLTLLEAGVTAGAAAKATEERKLKANTGKCADLGWVCVPVVAESYGAWGLTARDLFSKLGSRLATSLGKSKSVVTHELYGRMSMNLVRVNATAILSRSVPPPELQLASNLFLCVSCVCVMYLCLYMYFFMFNIIIHI